jgi:hypothetical protein
MFAAQLANAAEAVRAAAQAREGLLLGDDGDDAPALARASAELRAVSERESDARDRHAAAVAKRQACERELAELQEAAARDAEVERTDKMLSEVEDAISQLAAALDRFTKVALPFGVEGEQVARTTHEFRSQLPFAAARVIEFGRAYRREIATGGRPVPGPAKEEAAA